MTEVKKILPERLHPYIPDEYPDDVSGEEKVAYAVGFAVVQWDIKENGRDPERAAQIAENMIRQGAAQGHANSDLDLPLEFDSLELNIN